MVQKVEISWRTIVFTIVLLLFLKLLWISRELIYGLFLAFIFMSALKPAVNNLEKQRVPRSLAAFIVFIATVIFMLFLAAVVMPPVISESIAFFKNLPVLLSHTFPALSSYFNVNSDTIFGFLPNLTGNFVRFASGIFSNFIFIISVFFFTLYFLMEEKFIGNFLSRFISEKQAEKIVTILDRAEKRMGAWMWGEVLLMTIIGLVTYIGLTILQVKYALPLAVLAGLFEVVPIIGPIISLIPAFFVTAATSWSLGGLTIVLYFIIQQLENNLIVPIVMRRAVGLHPILTLSALTIGGKLGGFLGMLLSVPTALFIETILIEFTRSKK